MTQADARPGSAVGPRFLHGTRADLKPGDLIEPGAPAGTTHVYLTRNLDAAIWGAELAAGEGPGRVYVVEPIGQVEDDPAMTDQKAGHPSLGFALHIAVFVAV